MGLSHTADAFSFGAFESFCAAWPFGSVWLWNASGTR